MHSFPQYHLGSLVEMDTSNATYIIDGGFLLRRVIWHQNHTFLCVFNK